MQFFDNCICISDIRIYCFFHGYYDTKILVKLGLKERTVETNWAVVGWNNTVEKLDYDADIVFLEIQSQEVVILGSIFLKSALLIWDIQGIYWRE